MRRLRKLKACSNPTAIGDIKHFGPDIIETIYKFNIAGGAIQSHIMNL